MTMLLPRLRALAALTLVILASVAGIVGTGVIFTAVTERAIGALVWGLPLALGGLYWCSRALAQSQRGRRIRHQRGSMKR